MDAYSAPSHNSLAACEAPETEPLGPPDANRHRLPDERPALTHHFAVGGHEGYLTVGLYPNGQPGEIFIRMAKEGSTIAGLMECFGTVVSVSLQHGVPLRVLCDKLSHTRFEPSGWTGSAELGYSGLRSPTKVASERNAASRWLRVETEHLRFSSMWRMNPFTRSELRSSTNNSSGFLCKAAQAKITSKRSASR